MKGGGWLLLEIGIDLYFEFLESGTRVQHVPRWYTHARVCIYICIVDNQRYNTFERKWLGTDFIVMYERCNAG